MAGIRIVAAGAGSGKTRELTRIVLEAVEAGAFRPEALLATTFTRKAAAELGERLRVKLLEAGEGEAARALGAARVGTIHAVCQGLVQDFCLELSLSPELRVLEEKDAVAALARAMSAAITPEERAAAAELQRRWPEFDLAAAVKAVVDRARENGLGPDELATAAERSKATLRELFPGVEGDGAALDRALADALAAFVEAARTSGDTTKNTRATLELCSRHLEGFRQGRRPSWGDWLKLQKVEVGKKSKALVQPVREAAAAHAEHPGMLADGERMIELVMRAASGALAAYAAEKRAAGRIDFVDMEVLALDLLGRPSVREDLAGALDLVVVDEFQDTSPLQLGIVLALAELARGSVWVGDQKQAIYGFRSTDPKLMDAAVEALLAGREPDPLKLSYRSRPGLVRLVSELFAAPFDANGIPGRRVKLEPAREEPAGGVLGAEVERWELLTTNIQGDHQAIAQGVAALLADPDARVQDPATDEVRPVGPGDVAVLCRTNEQCDEVAKALEARGVRVSRARPGLLDTEEAQAALAGLRLWVDPEDSLAAATVLRLLRFPDRPDAWFGLALEKKPEGLADEEPVRALLALRKERPQAGPVAALDAVLSALGIKERCLGWSRAEERLENLEELRRLSVRFAAASAGTPAAFLGWLEENKKTLSQPGLAGSGVVQVSTWHGAKGLEWPVVVVHPIKDRADRAYAALGVQVAEDRQDLDLRHPLAGRWVRYLPRPFTGNQNGSRLQERLVAHPATRLAQDKEARESLRLLYVALTRARDRLVLPVRAGEQGGALGILGDPPQPLLAVPSGEGEHRVPGPWGELLVRSRSLSGQVVEAADRPTEPGSAPVPAGPREHPPARVSPSSLGEAAGTGEPVQLGPPLELRAGTDPIVAGDALHAFLAADREGLEEEARLAIARGLLDRHGLQGVLPGALLEAGDRLRRFVEGRWPKAAWRRELPLAMRLEGGSEMVGSCDLALELEAGWVVIDHKGMKVRVEDGLAAARAKAAAYGGQLRAYARMLTAATGRPVLGAWIHAAALGIIVPVELEQR